MIKFSSIPDADFSRAFAAHVAATHNLVCEVCGLGALGHKPESSWLGYDPHEFAGVQGDHTEAEKLSRLAYQAKHAQGLCGDYCQSTH